MYDISIGQAAKMTGVKVPTIRYYEQIGLLPSPVRNDGNRRQFGPADLHRLTFIRHARELDFEIDAIRALLTLQDDPAQPCATADSIAKERLADIEQRIRSLKLLRMELKRMIEGCGRGRVGQCRVIETLADHAKCVTPRH